MTEPRHFAISLFHRDHLSHGKNRQVLGFEAYHWGIIVVPGSNESPNCEAYDATDASEIDPVTWRMSNPTMDWWLRIRPAFSLDAEEKFLGYVIIGNVPDETSGSSLKQLFETVPLPVKNTHPQQSCVTWAVDAVLELQKRGLVGIFDVNELKNFVLAFADGRSEAQESRKYVTYEPARE